jgi:hypothetical protein
MAQTDGTKTKAQLKVLREANQKLLAENKQLEGRLEKEFGKTTIPSSALRKLAIILCVAAATAILVVGNIFFWAGNTLINTDRYVETVQPLLKDAAVQRAVADYTTTQLFKQVDVNQVVQDALPPRAQFLAPQLTSQLQNATDKTLQKVVAGDKFQAVWVNTNRTAHERLIGSIKNSTGDGVINLQDVYASLSQNLAGTRLSFLIGKSIPENIGSITVVDAPWIPKVRMVINDIGWLKPVSLLLVAAFSAAAIWLARNRRRVVIGLGVTVSASMAALLVAIHITKHMAAAQAAPAYQTAAEHAANIIARPLVLQTITILLLGLLVVLVGWLTGSYRSASFLRDGFDKYFTRPVHRTLFGQQESTLTRFVARYRQPIEWAIVAVIGFVTVMVRLSPKLVGLYALLMLLLICVIETLAAPHSKR